MTFGMSWLLYQQLMVLKDAQDESKIETIKTHHFLLSTIDWSTRRHRTILYMRDIIIAEWKRIGAKQDYNKAYIKAEAIVLECDKYPMVDPLSMLAVQRIESSFLDTLVSIRDARGSWQFVKSTALLLCQALGITHSDHIYQDPIISTKLAGKYFDVLYASYSDTLAMFADYNGGPRQASYYLYEKSKLSEETRNFIKNVKMTMDAYHTGILSYKPEEPAR